MPRRSVRREPRTLLIDLGQAVSPLNSIAIAGRAPVVVDARRAMSAQRPPPVSSSVPSAPARCPPIGMRRTRPPWLVAEHASLGAPALHDPRHAAQGRHAGARSCRSHSGPPPSDVSQGYVRTAAIFALQTLPASNPDRGARSEAQITHPAKNAATANVAYSAELAFALVVGFTMPPPPRPLSALKRPGPMKQTKPRKKTWMTGL